MVPVDMTHMKTLDALKRHITVLPAWKHQMHLLSAATLTLKMGRPALEWARIHYHVNQAHRGDRFAHEKIVVPEQPRCL